MSGLVIQHNRTLIEDLEADRSRQMDEVERLRRWLKKIARDTHGMGRDLARCALNSKANP